MWIEQWSKGQGTESLPKLNWRPWTKNKGGNPEKAKNWHRTTVKNIKFEGIEGKKCLGKI